MDDSKRKRLAGQVRRFRARFAQSTGSVLGQIIPSNELLQWVAEEMDDYRERLYGPLQTLTLFIE